jgi:hypothetical protein
MNNTYLTIEEINEAFRNVNLEENYNFLEDDLLKLANAFIMAAMPSIRRAELTMCVNYVRSLNTEVANALEDKRGKL